MVCASQMASPCELRDDHHVTILQPEIIDDSRVAIDFLVQITGTIQNSTSTALGLGSLL